MGEYRAMQLDDTLIALADETRRKILRQLATGEARVTEVAAPFDISLQAVSKHIQVLVRAGLVTQERTGRISRCRLDAGPIFTAAVWLNRYSRYWQAQFDLLAATLVDIDERRGASAAGPAKKRAGSRRKRRRSASPRRR
jgi:DNA-binding transcriptional ArsR family regulator